MPDQTNLNPDQLNQLVQMLIEMIQSGAGGPAQGAQLSNAMAMQKAAEASSAAQASLPAEELMTQAAGQYYADAANRGVPVAGGQISPEQLAVLNQLGLAQ